MTEPKPTENLATDELSIDELNSVAGGAMTSSKPDNPKSTTKQGLFEIEDFSFDIEQ
jgi:hypothetical protein